jgi:hypothetical protein
VQRRLGQPVGLTPGHRTAVELGRDLGLAERQLAAQEVAEQLVVAVPRPAAVQRDQEAVGSLERFEHARRVASFEHRVAQAAAHPVQDRCAREEAHLIGRQPREQLEPQVVGHEAVLAAEGLHLACCRAARPQRERGQVEARGPALGPLRELDDVGVSEVDAGTTQQRRRLVGVETQVVGADLHHPPLRPQPGQRQRRLLPARHHHLRSVRDVVEQCGDRVEARRIGQELHVVEDQDDRVRHAGERRTDARDAGRPDGLAGPRERLEHRRRDLLDAVQRHRYVAQQDHRIVVALVESDHRERPVVVLRQVGEQRGLAKARRRHQADGASIRRAEVTDEPPLRHRLHAQGRRSELRFDQVERELSGGHGPRASLAEPRDGRNHPLGVKAGGATLRVDVLERERRAEAHERVGLGVEARLLTGGLLGQDRRDQRLVTEGDPA